MHQIVMASVSKRLCLIAGTAVTHVKFPYQLLAHAPVKSVIGLRCVINIQVALPSAFLVW